MSIAHGLRQGMLDTCMNLTISPVTGTAGEASRQSTLQVSQTLDGESVEEYSQRGRLQ
jgi:hypothetical protein